MNIEELGDIIKTDLIIRRYANQNNRYMCQFEHAETKVNERDSILTGTYGNGDSPEDAIYKYVDKIRGLFLVVNAMGDNVVMKTYSTPSSRNVFGVPDDLQR